MAPNDKANQALFQGVVIGMLLKAQAERDDMPFNEICPTVTEEGDYGETIKIHFGESWWDLEILPGQPPTDEERGRRIRR